MGASEFVFSFAFRDHRLASESASESAHTRRKKLHRPPFSCFLRKTATTRWPHPKNCCRIAATNTPDSLANANINQVWTRWRHPKNMYFVRSESGGFLRVESPRWEKLSGTLGLSEAAASHGVRSVEPSQESARDPPGCCLSVAGTAGEQAAATTKSLNWTATTAP